MSDSASLLTLMAVAVLLVLAIASDPLSRVLSGFFGQRNRRSK